MRKFYARRIPAAQIRPFTKPRFARCAFLFSLKRCVAALSLGAFRIVIFVQFAFVWINATEVALGEVESGVNLTVGEPTRRPGGRTANVTRRINDAVRELLIEGGIEICTFANVAERAGVERSTLYRRYGDRWAMMIDAILGYAADEAAAVSLGSFRKDLGFVLDRMAEILATPLGPALWAVGAALRAGSAPEHRDRFWDTRIQRILPIFSAAKARGELLPGADPEEIFAFAMGAVHFRMLVIGQRVDSKRVDQIVDDVCRLYCRRKRSVEMQPAIAAAEE